MFHVFQGSDVKLGKREIDALTCPPHRRDLMVADDELSGFMLRVGASGVKVFLFQYRIGKQVRRLRLGTYGDLTPAQARRLAETARGHVAAGGDPVMERAATRRAALAADLERRTLAAADTLTLHALVEAWRDTGLADRSDSHRQEAPRAILAGLPGLLTTPAHRIDAAALQVELDRIGKLRPVSARRLRDYGRAMFGWAIKRRMLTVNPFAGVVIEAREQSRDRVLTDDELGEAWRVAGTMAQPFGPYLRLLILTLQRRTELAGMRWTELSADRCTWVLPAARAKNGKAHVVHLAPEARRILDGIVRVPDVSGHLSPLVFTTNGRTAISGFQNAKERLDGLVHAERRKRAGLPAIKARKDTPLPPPLGWRLHDLRRTGVTTLARLGIAPHVADRLLNHVQGTIRGVAAVYQRHEFLAERAAAMEAWADHVVAVGEPLPANVVRLVPRRPT